MPFGSCEEASALRYRQGEAMQHPFDVVIVGGGIAGGALATVLARRGISVAVLARDVEPVDRVRGESLVSWGVAELGRLDLLDVLQRSGGVFSQHNIPYDENTPGEQALAHAVRLSDIVPGVPGGFCMSHPTMCRALAAEAEAA